MRMRRIVICCLSGSTLFFQFTSQTARFSGGGGDIEYKMCAFIFTTTLPETFLILRKTEREMIKKTYIGLHGNYPLSLSDFNETGIFSTDFRKILEYQIS